MTPPVRVLVVDDEKLLRWSLTERLIRCGHAAEGAESASQAIELMSASPPDLMLLDVRLPDPGIDGLGLLDRAFRVNADMIVVMMSAHSTVDVAVEAMKRGASDFLVKPFPLAAVDAAIERALATHRMRKQISALTAERRGGERATLVGKSPAVEQLRIMVSRLAATDAATVLIEGESGAGKEVIARAIHFESGRADRPFLQLNCAALPEHLVESELFGHERGAFTDAHLQKRGLFESAEGGAVLLDELGDLPAGGQVKLLQLLENKTFRRVGGLGELRADVRVMAATNVDLERRVAEGRFRTDLFFRLNVVRLHVPPLREHPEDIPLLAAHFIARFNREMKREVAGISSPALELLCRYSWPGNVRELRNVIERALILHPDVHELRPEHLPVQMGRPQVASEGGAPLASSGMTLEEVERRLLADALDRASGNQSRAARLLGITRDTLRYRLKKHQLGHSD